MVKSRSFNYPVIKINEMVIEWKKQLTYLGVELDNRLRFWPEKMMAKGIHRGANLS